MGIRIILSSLGCAAVLSGCSDPSAGPGAGGEAGTAQTSGGSSSVTGGTGGSLAGGQGGSVANGGNAGSSGAAGVGGTAGSGGGAGNGGALAGGAGGNPSDFQPYFFDDFESYGDGAALSNNQPFDAAGRSTASAEVAFRGSRSARMEIRSGDGGGFGKWGGVIPIKPALKKGQEVWVRLQVLWPQSFQFSASPWMKFLRLHSTKADGGNAGYNDLYVDRADETQSVLRTIKEVHDVWAVYDGPKLPRDQWESYEMYLFIDDQSVDEGGGGRVRIWRNDSLIFDRTDVPTIVEAAGTIDYFYLFTYWNNEQPPDNHCFVDDLVIATDVSPPPNRDASGHTFIGAWTP